MKEKEEGKSAIKERDITDDIDDVYLEENLDKTIEEELEENTEIISNEDNEELEELEKPEIEENRVNNNYDVVKNNKLLFILFSLIIVIVAFIGVFSTIFALINCTNNRILKGISIEGIDVSNLTPEEAKEALNKVIDEKTKTVITLKHENYETTISLETLELKYNIDGALEKAFNYGRDENTFSNNYKILMLKSNPINIDMDFEINQDEIDNIEETINNEIDGAAVQYSYYVDKETNTLIITSGKEGNGVNSNLFTEMLKANLANLNNAENYIEIPTIIKQPDTIDVDKIYEEVHKEPQDATYTTNPFKITPEVDGVNFDKEAVKALINSEAKDEYDVKLTITKAKNTISSIGEEAYPNVIASFSTNYDASNTDRTTNLKLAAQKINGTVIMPEEEFSYNKVVGERTIAAGYKNAKVYSNGEVVDGLGGGICQVSSTLYNTAVISNLKITQRRNHQFVTSYLPAGRDATVVWGSQDFKFVNTRKYPIKIKASVSGGVVTITFEGLKEETEYDISFQSVTISTIPTTTRYQDDDTLAAGTEKVKQKGAIGKIVETYKIMSLNGQVVSKTLLSRDTYNAMQKIILRGTRTE